MSKYVDGFLIPVPTNKLEVYREMAEKAAAIWIEYGALEYRECAGDDMEVPEQRKFPSVIEASGEETVVLAWIVYESKEHRDAVNAKLMADPRIHAMCDPLNPPFDFRKMAYGGFRTIVERMKPSTDGC